MRLPQPATNEGVLWTNGVDIRAYLPILAIIDNTPQGYHVRGTALELTNVVLNLGIPSRSRYAACSELTKLARQGQYLAPKPHNGIILLSDEDVEAVYRHL